MLEPTNFDYLQDSARSVLTHLTSTAPFLSNYTLVGGSALALYLRHRKSEDLDSFSYTDNFNRQELFDYIKEFEQKEILTDSREQMDLLLNGVKVTFFNAQWSFLQPQKVQPLNIADLTSIAAMKTNALFLRAKYRDYYDLYCLSRKVMGLKDIFDTARPLIEGLNTKLFCIALTFIDDIEDDDISHLAPAEVISKQGIRTYFEKEIRRQFTQGI